MSSERILTKREITMLGHPTEDSHAAKCGSCEKVENVISEAAKSNPLIEYKSIDVYTPEGQKMAEEHKLEEMPLTKDCRIYDKGEPDCRTVKGWDSNDWTDLISKPKVEETKTETTTVV